MGDRCTYYPEAGPNEVDGAQMCGLCPNCRDHDIVSYFCSEGCYNKNVVGFLIIPLEEILMKDRRPIVMKSTTEGISPTLVRLLIDSKRLWTWRSCPKYPCGSYHK